MAPMERPGEHVDDLMFKGLRIIQSRTGFRYGMDAVLLAGFARPRGAGVLDLGTGTGIVALLLAGINEAAHITALEIQPEMADMARRSVRLNHLERRIDVLCADLRAHKELLQAGQYDVVVCNPPYTRADEGSASPTKSQAMARHEHSCTLDDVAQAGYYALKYGGYMALIIRAQRTVDLLETLRRHKIEPKRARLVCPRRASPPNLLLVEGIKHGKPGLLWEPPLVVFGDDGRYTPELRAIYHMEEDDGG
ncbi:MAG: tRNA1(Val) (adenine(37)-N6)-methyltransferase [Eubacteriales bacterium]|nr:tRNA1(Val) (adenine(37)-N6)-methyltransferase [Eubacteriales bacterium]